MFKNILVPTDGSPLSLKPANAALEFAKSNGGRIVGLSVSEPRLFYGQDPESAEAGDLHEENNRLEAEKNLEYLKKMAETANVPFVSIVAQSRTPGDEIIRLANEYQCDAIFMATRGSFGVIEKLFNESQTHKVLEGSSVPVVVFP